MNELPQNKFTNINHLINTNPFKILQLLYFAKLADTLTISLVIL